MAEHRVYWEIDVDAETVGEAAEKALAIQRDPKSIATVFHVSRLGRPGVRTVDLQAERSSRFGCPFCEGKNIDEAWYLGYRALVTEWDENGDPADRGEPETLDAIREWEPAERFLCRDCSKVFPKPKRL
jgi:hypothetical protein